ncbi:MarR family transcriptional regulator [Paenibacillus alvei]|uniref:MarR family winged helix-turn-helix transcriptional regulator n=1 Tax=Paenibacillus alvei TaxID=44250 RepID=UPI0013D9E5CA|nr:MarR family transcriptional regulator [Paenibacillus alvei]MCY9582612.1 MarR family transcriptional regulator [Paenibacillus alvei]MCY9587827.1 MarR family transcriptional regulator [Paenibacillus alvei]NEZ40750.1 MarR family transcriptional regulator [Paenibacillus alvei]
MNDIEKKAYIFGGILTLANRLQALGDKLDENVTLKQWLLIAVILKSGRSSPTISEVAKLVGNSRQNVKKMAGLLEKQGFVSLIKDDQDARIFRIHLTPECFTYFQARSEKEMQFLNALFDALDENLTNGLYEGVIQLANNVNRMENAHEVEEKG